MEESAREEGGIFSEIKAAENEAELIIGNAQKEKQRIIDEAKKEAAMIISGGIEKSKAGHEKRLLQFREKLLKEKEKLIAEGNGKTLAMAKGAEKNIPKAAISVAERFRQRLKC